MDGEDTPAKRVKELATLRGWLIFTAAVIEIVSLMSCCWRWRSQTTSPRRLLVVRPDGDILLRRLGSSPSVIGANLFVCGLVVKAEALISARLFPMKTRGRPIGETTSAVTASTLSISGLHGWRSIETQLRSPRIKLRELGFGSFGWSWASAHGGLGL
ncbi:hypothetical protein F2Q69_00011203 [Brassica cretica]|uniref:Uncharacterized protein n=1 Tax=Brassica cretica TaxID=69181 RepID=A0A8S9QZB9_BRACR|nr:hypothetical protein F2Q69_00011203 [Brassica cretica]